MTLLLFNAFNGLIQGVFYALMALGLALILSLNSVINMAHGGFFVIGAYLAFTLNPYLGFWGALIVGPLLAAGVGLIVERLLIRPIYKRADPLYNDLRTLGRALLSEEKARPLGGQDRRAAEGQEQVVERIGADYFFIT